MQDLIAGIRERQAKVKELETEIADIKAELWPIVEASGGRLTTESGLAQIVPPAQRDAFDTKGLVNAMRDNQWLEQFYKPTTIKSYLKIT